MGVELVSLVCAILLSNKSHLFSSKVADCSFCVELKYRSVAIFSMYQCIPTM